MIRMVLKSKIQTNDNIKRLFKFILLFYKFKQSLNSYKILNTMIQYS